MPRIPTLFIGSSTEGINVAQEIHNNLTRRRSPDGSKVVDPRMWNQGLFQIGELVPDKLREIATTYDFAALVFSPDDIVLSRGVQKVTPRDNIVFELGLFAGQLGRERSFAVVHEQERPKLPSDFAGVTHTSYAIDRDERGKETPSVDLACNDIAEAVERLGKLRHPALEIEETLDAIVQNHRCAFRVKHPLFQDYLRRWCYREKEDSEFWMKGMLRVKVDFADIFFTLYKNAKKSIFSASIPASRNIWNERWGKRLLQAQRDNKSVKSVRVFVYPNKTSITKDDVLVMQQHKDAGVEVRVFVEPSQRAFSYETGKTENEWSMIDDGEAIGVTRRIEPGAMEVHWLFADPVQRDRYKWLKENLVNMSDPLDDWLSQQQPIAA